MIKVTSNIREAGWLDIGLSSSGPVLFFEALKRLHRLSLPLATPLLEIWTALRLLERLDTASAAHLAEAARSTGTFLTVSTDDLVSPRHGLEASVGPITFASACDILVLARRGDVVEVHRVLRTRQQLSDAVNLDPTAPRARITVNLRDAEMVGSLGFADWERVRSELLIAQAAAMVGQAQGMLEMTLAHLRTRRQFGVPLGSFQALRHRCADLFSELQVANLISGHAAWETRKAGNLAPLGLLAKAYCGRVALEVAGEAIQLHGGLGFTWEMPLHFGLRRSAQLAMSGISVHQCELGLGEWATNARSLRWPVPGEDDD